MLALREIDGSVIVEIVGVLMVIWLLVTLGVVTRTFWGY